MSSHIHGSTCQFSHSDNHHLSTAAKGNKGDRCLLPCVSTPAHFTGTQISHSIPSTAPLHILSCPPEVGAAIPSKDLRTPEIVVLQHHRFFQLMPSFAFIQMVMLCSPGLVLGQTWGGIIILCMNGTILVPSMVPCLTLSRAVAHRR